MSEKEKKMKEYYRQNPDAFSVNEIADETFRKWQTEEKKILWTVSVISWGCFLAGAVLSIIRLYDPGSI